MNHKDDVYNTPFFIDLQKEYFEQKEVLDKWHEKNSYAKINNSEPYPKECLYKMLDLLEIMDAMYYYSPSGKGYVKTKEHYLLYLN